MIKVNDKWIEIIAKLTKLTQDNILQWRISEVPESLKGFKEERVDVVYISIYNGKRLRIYEKKKKETIVVGFNRFETLWETYTVLDFSDKTGISLWAFPAVEGLNNLLNAVRFQVTEVKNFLKALMED